MTPKDVLQRRLFQARVLRDRKAKELKHLAQLVESLETRLLIDSTRADQELRDGKTMSLEQLRKELDEEPN